MLCSSAQELAGHLGVGPGSRQCKVPDSTLKLNTCLLPRKKTVQESAVETPLKRVAASTAMNIPCFVCLDR